MRAEPELIRQDYPRCAGEIPAGIFDFLSDGKGGRTVETHKTVYRGYRECGRISQSAAFFPRL